VLEEINGLLDAGLISSNTFQRTCCCSSSSFVLMLLLLAAADALDRYL
jgi:hypothetical protein